MTTSSGSNPVSELYALPRLPRDQDGPVFTEPWQAQAFAIAVRLSADGHFTWKEWAAALAGELQAAADRGEPDDGSRYYEHWLAALERLTIQKRLTEPDALLARKDAWADAYRDTPHGKPVELRGRIGRAPRLGRQRVVLADGRVVELLQRRAHLSYCFNSCCCGRVDRGYPEVPVDLYKSEWLRRKLRKTVHLTKAGCLGPCRLANVASLLIDGRSIWFHSVNTPADVVRIYDYLEQLLATDELVPAPPELTGLIFDFYDWTRVVHAPALAAPSASAAREA